LLAHGRWFSPGTPASSTTKTGHHDIAEILLKVALNTKNQNQKSNLMEENIQKLCTKIFKYKPVSSAVFSNHESVLRITNCCFTVMN
jgi:hypothetical protein